MNHQQQVTGLRCVDYPLGWPTDHPHREVHPESRWMPQKSVYGSPGPCLLGGERTASVASQTPSLDSERADCALRTNNPVRLLVHLSDSCGRFRAVAKLGTTFARSMDAPQGSRSAGRRPWRQIVQAHSSPLNSSASRQRPENGLLEIDLHSPILFSGW